MSKVTSKLQVTIPKAIANEYGIAPGDEIEFEPAGPQIRVVPHGRQGRNHLSRAERLRLFDEATARQAAREEHRWEDTDPPDDRGWTREDLYERGSAD